MRLALRAGRATALPAFAFLALTLSLSGCATTIDATSLGVPATLASAAEHHPDGDAFHVSTHAVYGLWGLAQLKSPSVRKILAGQLVGNNSLSEVKIRVRSRWSDVLISALTLGLVVPRTVTVEGVVVKQP
ncbi:MAG: hypothetical protein ABI836_10620 [Gemmatimonadota bacterium]